MAAEPREAHTDAARRHCGPGSKQAAAHRPFCSRPVDEVDQASGHVTVSPPHLQGRAGTRPTRKETPTPLKDPHRSTNRRNAMGLGSALKTLEIRGKGRRQVPRALPCLTTEASTLPSVFQGTRRGGRGGRSVRVGSGPQAQHTARSPRPEGQPHGRGPGCLATGAVSPTSTAIRSELTSATWHCSGVTLFPMIIPCFQKLQCFLVTLLVTASEKNNDHPPRLKHGRQPAHTGSGLARPARSALNTRLSPAMSDIERKRVSSRGFPPIIRNTKQYLSPSKTPPGGHTTGSLGARARQAGKGPHRGPNVLLVRRTCGQSRGLGPPAYRGASAQRGARPDCQRSPRGTRLHSQRPLAAATWGRAPGHRVPGLLCRQPPAGQWSEDGHTRDPATCLRSRCP